MTHNTNVTVTQLYSFVIRKWWLRNLKLMLVLCVFAFNVCMHIEVMLAWVC